MIPARWDALVIQDAGIIANAMGVQTENTEGTENQLNKEKTEETEKTENQLIFSFQLLETRNQLIIKSNENAAVLPRYIVGRHFAEAV